MQYGSLRVAGDIVWMEETRKVTVKLMTKYSTLRLYKYSEGNIV